MVVFYNDVVGVLTDSANPRDYWSKIKTIVPDIFKKMLYFFQV